MNTPRRRPWRRALAAITLGAGLLGVTAQALALTPAGTEINNRATVTYQDASGNSYLAQSNESTVTVAEVYSASLVDSNDKNGAPGETVYFPHTLENTGNTQDSYTLSAGGGYNVYHDLNGNGRPDSGEPIVSTTNPDLTLNAGQRAELVVAVPVPSSSTATSAVITTKLTAQSFAENSVELTNDNTVTVTEDAVLVPTKSAVVDYDNNQITYTLEVTNTGSSAATDVDILDAIPEGTTFSSVDEVNGLLTNNGDTIPSATSNIGEPTGLDLNGNGTDSEGSVSGIIFTDAELPSNTTVSIVYTVDLDATLDAGTPIRNTFAAQIGSEPAVPSNRVTTEVLQTYGVTIDDIGTNTTVTIADDGTASDDIALRDSAPSAGTALFSHQVTNGDQVTNGGNGPDAFDLAIDSDTFPTGTVFSFWNASNTSQLTDTNGNGVPDTGVMERQDTRNITVRAKLPAGVSGDNGGNGYTYTISATTYEGTNVTASDELASDTSTGTLTTISESGVDLANSYSGSGDDLLDTTTNKDEFAPPNTTATESTSIGGTVTIPLYLANNGGSPQSFDLGADLPPGWSVTFREVGIDTTSDGNADVTNNAGRTVSSTPSLPADAVYFYEAVVQVSSVSSQAVANFTGTITNSDGGTDLSLNSTSVTSAKGAYPIRFFVDSTSTGLSDDVQNAVKITDNRNITLSPDGANQVQPGGNVDYLHVLANRGNSIEQITLTPANSLSGDAWSNNTQVYVDGDGWVNLNTLTDGTAQLRQPDGNFIDVGIANQGATPTLTLDPGERVDIKVVVFAPSSAAAGSVDSYTLDAVTADSGPAVTATNLTEVIVGQVRLRKSAAIDTGCACADASPTWPADTDFETVQTTGVAPDQCVVWRLIATNEGTTTAEAVEISDRAGTFTTLEAAKDAVVASTSAATSNSGTDPEVIWEVGALSSGDSVEAQFCVKVD